MVPVPGQAERSPGVRVDGLGDLAVNNRNSISRPISGNRRGLADPLVGVTPKRGSIVESRRGAHVSGGLPHRRPLIVVDHVPPDSVRAAAHNVACRASEVHVRTVGTCAVN
jgi:hypothetical protein